MKILTGQYRGLPISFTPNRLLRPTTDKARKAIFDMFQGVLPDKVVLDLFSGTGALGFEALSQGASRVVFVEEDRAQCKKIKENLERWKLETSSEVHQDEALHWLAKNLEQAGAFDLIFLDPPYASGLALKALEMIAGSEVLQKGGFVVLECRKKDKIPLSCGRLQAVRDKKYGQTKVLVYQMS